MAHLKLRAGTGRNDVYDLRDREMTVGRQPDCDIVIPKQFVSRKHARIAPETAGRWKVVDLDSSHGTFVNRLRVKEKVLAAGDQIVIGEDILVYEDGPAPAVAVSIGPSSRGAAPEITNPEPHPISSLITTDAKILSEAGIGEGDLMRTMLDARRRDVADLGRSTAPGSTDSAARDVAGHLLALVKISDELRRCTDVDAVCRVAVEMAVRTTGANRGAIGLWDDEAAAFVTRLTFDGSGRKSGGSLVISRTFVDKVVRDRIALIARDTNMDIELSGADSIVAAGIRSILCAPMWDGTGNPGDSGEQILGFLYLDITDGRRAFRNADLDLVTAIGHQAAAEISRLRLVDRIRSEEGRRRDLARFMSADVIRHIEEESKKNGGKSLIHTAKEMEVTILFADIQGFTRVAERLSPADVKKFLDEYLDYMTEVLVDQHGGTLDKYIGDAIMALWGAPFSKGIAIDAGNAVGAAVAMRDTMDVLRKTRPDFAHVEVRIGINTGRVVAGMIGSQRRLEYSVIGDPVNVASRLESSGEAGRILIGEATWEHIKDDFDCTFAGERQLRNREKSVKAWWVVGPRFEA